MRNARNVLKIVVLIVGIIVAGYFLHTFNFLGGMI